MPPRSPLHYQLENGGAKKSKSRKPKKSETKEKNRRFPAFRFFSKKYSTFRQPRDYYSACSPSRSSSIKYQLSRVIACHAQRINFNRGWAARAGQHTHTPVLCIGKGGYGGAYISHLTHVRNGTKYCPDVVCHDAGWIHACNTSIHTSPVLYSHLPIWYGNIKPMRHGSRSRHSGHAFARPMLPHAFSMHPLHPLPPPGQPGIARTLSGSRGLRALALPHLEPRPDNPT